MKTDFSIQPVTGSISITICLEYGLPDSNADEQGKNARSAHAEIRKVHVVECPDPGSSEADLQPIGSGNDRLNSQGCAYSVSQCNEPRVMNCH